MQPSLTILTHYDIQTTPEAFVLAIKALAARVQAEGHQGVLGYRFFCSPVQMQARAVVDYAGPEAWIGHHDISMEWPEMQALHHAARLSAKPCGQPEASLRRAAGFWLWWALMF